MYISLIVVKSIIIVVDYNDQWFMQNTFLLQLVLVALHLFKLEVLSYKLEFESPSYHLVYLRVT